jgi:hypothetical protein
VAELGRGAHHLEAAIDAHALLARVVVDEADRAEVELGVAQQLAQEQPTAVAGADDQHAAGVAARREAAQRALVDEVHEEARAGEEERHQQAPQHEHPGGDAERDEARRRQDQPRLDHRHVADQREHAEQRALGDLQVLGLRRVPHPVAVRADERERDQRPENRERERPQEQIVIGGRDATIEPEPVGKVIGQRDQPRIQRDLRKGVAMDRKGRGADPAAHPGQCIDRVGQRTCG